MSTKVLDPVCGMQVDPANSAGSFKYKGATYHFCSTRCLAKFKSDPDGILTREVPQAAAKDSVAIPVTANGPLYTLACTPTSRQS
jgi:P-type Cu+ transporter